MIPRTQALGVQECGFGSGKITQGDIGNAKKQECVVIVGTEFQFAFELQAGLRIGFFATELEDGVAQQAVSVRIFWIELNGFAKFGDRRFRKMADGIGTADENMQGGGISHGVLQVLKPFLGIGETLGPQIGNA